ncbi:MAG: hypothetical protein CMI00_14500 [Oceanospirillaceae bacterium]|nr:hypothetical protein [Oceanospirillaceae bacterium]|tara:strand:+ start:2771 stop:4546 length:1776 start_codon:yes stop_codon:yes gene_type:complete
MKNSPYTLAALLTCCSLLSGCFDREGDTGEVTEVSLSQQAEYQQNTPEQAPAANPVADNYSYGTLTDITADVSENPVAYVPPQCYTTPVEGETVHNPCYVCHTASKRPNNLNDIDVQLAYSFPERGLINNWDNTFKDRTAAIADISDEEIQEYTAQDNYQSENGGIILAAKLASPPEQWDRNRNGKWDGYIPDAWFNFDENGFDVAPNGEYSGWRVYAYYPFPGTFMPTNGSTDDVMIRLPQAFRELPDGTYDQETYEVNLAIVEAMMKEKDVPLTPVNEAKFNVDLNGNGLEDIATFVHYDWSPREGRMMTYVGRAKTLLDAGELHIAARLMPEGTEFLHSVRYLDTRGEKTGLAPRMKELRYAYKNSWRDYNQLRIIVDKEIKERHDFPDRTKRLTGNMESGLNLPHGWTYQGFIEDDAGELRPQTYEETFACMGCHGYTGSSNDTNISFSRKFDAGTSYRDGWYYWLEKDLSGVADPLREDGQGEFSYYLKNNPTGNEFRDNPEVLARFFDEQGQPREDAFATLQQDISYLLMPSKERALKLNKAYRVIVDEQSFIDGRDPVVTPLSNIYHEVELDQETGITEVLSYY